MSWPSSSSLFSLGLPLAVALCVVTPIGCVGADSARAVPGDLSASDLVHQAVSNEIAASRDASIKHMFRSRKQIGRGSQTRLYVETRDAIAAMTIAYDDKPISEDQVQGEFRHLQHLIDDRNDLHRKQKQEHEDAEHTLRIVKAMPDAFIYEFDGTQPSPPNVGRAGDELVRLKFRPNPRYTPPSRVEQVLMGMHGSVLIDKGALRLAEISASLFREVSFGWGILGHLDKGGSFLVQQADVGDGTWEITHIQLNFTGKIMLVKSLAIESDENFSDFRPVPAAMTFAEGVELLKQEWTKLQQADSVTTVGESSH
jgi:hypothetical protein